MRPLAFEINFRLGNRGNCAQRLCFCSGGLSKPRPVHVEKRYRINVLNTLMSRHHYRNILLATVRSPTFIFYSNKTTLSTHTELSALIDWLSWCSGMCGQTMCARLNYFFFFLLFLEFPSLPFLIKSTSLEMAS